MEVCASYCQLSNPDSTTMHFLGSIDIIFAMISSPPREPFYLILTDFDERTVLCMCGNT